MKKIAKSKKVVDLTVDELKSLIYESFAQALKEYFPFPAFLNLSEREQLLITYFLLSRGKKE